MMTQPPRLSVIGTGYLGATHAVCMVELGYEVIALDIDEAKIEGLRAGKIPFFEPGLPELLAKHIDSGRLRFTTDYTEVAEFADVHFICVGTPQKPGQYAADMTYVVSAFTSLAPYLTRRALVVGKSTVPAGTAAQMAALLAELAPNSEVELAWNPEFLREGFAVEDTLRPDRLVFGVHSEWAELTIRSAFAPVIAAGTPVIVTDFATAELVKVAANSFLATKISFINAMAEVCEVTGADVTQLADAIGHDVRIGRKFLNAGLGFGGGCLPKDIRAFIARAGELGVDQAVSFLRDVDEINQRPTRRQLPGHQGRGVGRGVQTQLRRHPRLAGPGRCRRGRTPRRRGQGIRPRGECERAAGTSGTHVCRFPRCRGRRCRSDHAAHRMGRLPSHGSRRDRSEGGPAQRR